MKKRKSRFQPYLTDGLLKRIELYCAQRGVHLSAFAEETFVQRLDGTSDMSLLYRRIDSVNRRLERLARQVEIQGEFISEFAQVWLRNTPQLPDPDKQANSRLAHARYQRMLERTAQRISAGKTFVDDLPQEMLTSEGLDLSNDDQPASNAPSP